jgi:NAD(P)-dependent dehydrogenase (short-subunit alcohol dehydrogenase family)
MGSIAENSSGGYYAYRISKAALNMFTKSFSIDYPKITCISLHPGWVRTDMGGADAALLPRESARGLFKLIIEAKNENSGRMYDYSGKEIPW